MSGYKELGYIEKSTVDSTSAQIQYKEADIMIYVGIDLIIELPLIYTLERADIFASYSVKLLNMMKVNEIWIGSENNDLSLYEKYYNDNIIIDNKSDYSSSYKDKSNLNLLSNDILGYSYYKAIMDNKFDIKLIGETRRPKEIDNDIDDNRGRQIMDYLIESKSEIEKMVILDDNDEGISNLFDEVFIKVNRFYGLNEEIYAKIKMILD